MAKFQCDLFVIGGGSGGVRAARLAAQAGWNTGLAEADRMGGTCVIRGCVPKKIMMFASSFTKVFALAKGYGWQVDAPEFAYPQFINKVHAELNRLEGVYTTNLEKAGVHIHKAFASFIDEHSVELSNGDIVRANYFLIATGGRPFVPEVKGRGLAQISDDMFEFESLPQRVVVVGGGYIASEFAGIFNGLGSKVTQVYRGEHILRGFDSELTEYAAKAMTARGIEILTHTDVERLAPSPEGKRVVHLSNGDVIEADAVLYATGRVAATEGLQLEKAGVGLDHRGYIQVDKYSQTSQHHIYAVGDVTGRAALTPVAIREGAAFVDTIVHGKPNAVDHSLIPTAIFTQPELGTCGIAEDAALDEGRAIDVYVTKFRTMLHAMGDSDEQCFMKLIVDRHSDEVIGCHIAGDGAGEMIQLLGIPMTMGAKKADFDRTIAVHPTAAEELVTFKTPTRSF